MARGEASRIRYLNPRNFDHHDCVNCELETTLAPDDPELAARLTRLLDGTEKQWSIDGHEFALGALIPYDPALAEEIEASIREYLGSQ